MAKKNKKTKPVSQSDMVLAHLSRRKKNTINPMQALEWFGCFRLSDIIFKAKKRGYVFTTVLIKNSYGNKFAEYKLM